MTAVKGIANLFIMMLVFIALYPLMIEPIQIILLKMGELESFFMVMIPFVLILGIILDPFKRIFNPAGGV